ncbi:AAA-domain-containing protein [Tuber magnatum]|uniref:Peroxisomal ATPase PEX1 n=1 Tax=Tuber magnatum TaxID=42249 RepID=A0A317SR13_9PEZI|nr:AAA-domain-containing protein [Tuber magnatum]
MLTMAGNRQSLTKGLERRVLTIVRRYIDEHSVTEGNNGSLYLSVSQVYQYVTTDRSMRRQRRRNLEKIIEKALATVRGEEAEADGLDSDLGEVEELNEEDLMELKQSNTINQQVADSTIPTSPAPRKQKERQSVKDGELVKRQKQDNSREPPKNISLKNIGGRGEVINDLLEFIAMPLVHPEVNQHTGVQPPCGVLLHGPPGCGKTMLANAIAREVGLPFIAISAPSIVSGMSGESEKMLRELFEEARGIAPCLIFIDEIDAITQKRENTQRDMERRIVAQMLTCMDDLTLEKTGGKPVMIIGATNRPDSLDPALRRAGRFDKEIYLGVPDEVGREKILRILCENLRLIGGFDFKELAMATAGFVGADLSALVREAGTSGSLSPIQCFLRAHPHRLTGKQLDPLYITFPDFLTALTKIQPSSKREGFATVPDVTWADVGALESHKAELQMAIVLPIKKPELFASVGLTAPSGVLLWGPPGCGKTLLAKAVANESGANLISIRGPELLNKYIGESERAVRQVFLRAQASIPCVIFFDELDALAPHRNDNLSESSSRVVNTLLTELDGFNDRKGIYIIAATNRPDMIDPSILRPGRLDTLLLEILKTITKKTPLSNNVDLRAIAEHSRCKNFSGADLVALVKRATTLALRESFFTGVGEVEEGKNQVVVTMEHLEKGSANIRPSVSEDRRKQYQELATTFGLEGQ